MTPSVIPPEDRCECGVCRKTECERGCLDAHEDGETAEGEDQYDAGEECGRWINGRLGKHCLLAGTEFCDWDCPYS